MRADSKITGKPLPGCVPPPTRYIPSNSSNRFCGRKFSICLKLWARLNVAPRYTSTLFSQSAGVTARSKRMRFSMSVMPSFSSWRRATPRYRTRSFFQSTFGCWCVTGSSTYNALCPRGAMVASVRTGFST